MKTIVADKVLFKLHYKIPTIEVQTKMWSHGLAGADHSLPFDFESDNYVGAFLQMNTPKASWITFFRDCRLLPQIKMADRNVHKTAIPKRNLCILASVTERSE